MTPSRLREAAATALLSLSIAALCLFPYCASAQEFYRWVDEKGAVHFTDNLYSVPEKYRSQIEKRNYVPTPEPTAPAAQQATRGAERPQTRRITVPFKREGNLIIVEGSVNQAVPARFILDTGAEISTVPRSVGQQLGIDPDAGVLITITGMGGSTDVPLVEINSISVGEAQVNSLDVTLSDTPLPDTGLLGGDFLADYKVNILYEENQVLLEPQERPYGGHTFEWWQKKFRLFQRIKQRYETLGGGSGAGGMSEIAAKQLRAVERRINDLETRASQAGIPREYRQ